MFIARRSAVSQRGGASPEFDDLFSVMCFAVQHATDDNPVEIIENGKTRIAQVFSDGRTINFLEGGKRGGRR